MGITKFVVMVIASVIVALVSTALSTILGIVYPNDLAIVIHSLALLVMGGAIGMAILNYR